MPLIVITGIPCSGKSTVTKAIKEHLETQSKKVRIHLRFTGMRQFGWTPDKLKAALSGSVVFDGRNIYSPPEMKALGFDYYSIGR